MQYLISLPSSFKFACICFTSSKRGRLLSQKTFLSRDESRPLIILIRCKQVQRLKVESYALLEHALRNLRLMF